MNTAFFCGSVVCLAGAALASVFAANPQAPGTNHKAVTLEAIPGSAVKRVILTAKSAERLGIETGKVTQQPIVRRQMVGGLVVPPVEKPLEPKPAGAGRVADLAQTAATPAATRAPPPMSGGGFGGFTAPVPPPPIQPRSAAPAGPKRAASGPESQPGPPPQAPAASNEVWVLVTLSQAEWDRLATDKPARVLPLATRGQPTGEVLARPSGMPPQEDSKRSMLKLYYVIPGKDHGLMLNKRMRVELELKGSDAVHTVVPYNSIYYDAKGTAWVYASAQPLTYERRRVSIDRIVGDLAVLADGPLPGTSVVTTGAALLYGAEIFGK